MMFYPDQSAVKTVLEELSKDYILIKRKDLRDRTRKGMENAKKEGRHLGRPFALTSKQVRDILTMLDEGYSYRKVAEKFNISHTAVAKIKQEGLTRCDKIDSFPKIEKSTIQPEIDDQRITFLNTYANTLKTELKKKDINLTTNECYEIIKKILVFDVTDTEIVKPSRFEYQPQNSYIALTMHSLKN